jgi:hypothetical protein
LTVHRILALALILFSAVVGIPIYRKADDEEEAPIVAEAPPKRKIISIISLFAATVVLLVSILWQHTASVAAASSTQAWTYGVVTTSIGSVATGLGWSGFAISAVIFGARIITRIPWLTDFDDESTKED